MYKLCEFEGQQIPDDYKSDCYKDVDESDYACKEKYRIMVWNDGVIFLKTKLFTSTFYGFAITV